MELASRWALDRVGPDDWRRWSLLRLAALADAPDAFSSTVAREQGFDEGEWRDRLAAGPRVIARIGEGDVGLVGVHLADGPREPQVYGMWIHPVWRGTGLADALVVEVLSWARGTGQDHLRLWVMPDNARARNLYERHGFRVEDEPPVTAPGACELALRHDLRS